MSLAALAPTNTLEAYLKSIQQKEGHSTPTSLEDAKIRRMQLVREIHGIDREISLVNGLIHTATPKEITSRKARRKELVDTKQRKILELQWVKSWIRLKIQAVDKAAQVDSSNPIVLLNAASELLQLLKVEEVDFDESELALIEAIRLHVLGH